MYKRQPAEKAGLKEKDIIRKLDKKTVKGPAHFRTLMAKLKAGQTITLGILRKGKELKIKVTLGERPPTFRPFRPPRLLPFVPRIEKGKGKIILRWKTPDGREHEETIELPFPEEFEFHFPKLPDFPKGEEWRKHIERSLQEARKRIEEFAKELREKHEALKRKLRCGKTLRIEGAEPSIRTEILTKSGLFVSYSDGVYEISIKMEDGIKTVTVKKHGKVIAKNLPYEKIKTLPKDVQEKIKELEEEVRIEIKTEGKPWKFPEKMILELPTQRA